MGNMKKNYGCILAALILLTACGQKKEDSVTTVRPVKTARVESRSEIRKDFSGIVEAVDYVKLAFRVSGQIINLPVVEGQRVKKGQLIAAIDPRDLALQYAADKSAYETAAAQVERNKRLLARQAISVQEYEISVSTFQQKKSAYELSSNNMRDTRLTAPFDGSIEKRLVENYQRVNSGEGIVQLVNTKKTTHQIHYPRRLPLPAPLQRPTFPRRIRHLPRAHLQRQTGGVSRHIDRRYRYPGDHHDRRSGFRPCPVRSKTGLYVQHPLLCRCRPVPGRKHDGGAAERDIR